jgi:hypothetical protein
LQTVQIYGWPADYGAENPLGAGKGILHGAKAYKFNWPNCGSGLFLPHRRRRWSKIVPVVEGVRDVFTFDALGVWAIGTLSAAAGAEHLIAWARQNPGCVFVLIIENDQKPDGSWPSREGRLVIAETLGKAGIPSFSSQTYGNHKDITACYQSGCEFNPIWFEKDRTLYSAQIQSPQGVGKELGKLSAKL